MNDDEPCCGRELAASAEVPEALGALMNHVAMNLDAHAAWVGSNSEAARLERDAMTLVAREYRAIGSAAARAAAVMRSFAELEPAPHDPARFDRAAFAAWMREKITQQRALASLLLEHAAVSERALVAMK